jgi:hypothetical protein
VGAIFLVLGSALLVMIEVLFGGGWLWLPLLCLPVFVVGLLKGRYPLAITGLVLFYAGSFSLYLEPWEEFKPVRHLARTIAEETSRAGTESNSVAGYYKFAAPSLAFYLNRPIVELSDPEEAASLLESDGAVYLIVSSEDYPELTRASSRPVEIVEARPKLYTTLRTLIEGFRRGSSDNLRKNWIRPVYLITNRPVD